MRPWLLLTLALTACGWSRVAYDAKQVPEELVLEEFRRLALSTTGFPPLKIDIGPTFASLLYANGPYGMLNNFVITFADIDRLEVKQKRSYFGVEAYDNTGGTVCWFEYDSLLKAQKMADVLSTLSRAPPAAPAKPSSTTTM